MSIQAMRGHIELVAKRVIFYSSGDEDAFFQWLDKLRCVQRYEGKGDALYIDVLRRSVNQYALRELLALFHRYGIDKKQLSVFDKRSFDSWFRDERKYWFAEVFGTETGKSRKTEVRH
jgi:hypothetical protein